MHTIRKGLLNTCIISLVWQTNARLSARALTLLVLGGCLYSVGVIFHLWERLKFHNAIWHGFVLVAPACHFGAVCDAVFLT